MKPIKLKSFDEYKKIFLKLFLKKHSLPHRNPYRDWKKMFYAAVGVALVIVGIEGYFFYKVERGDVFESNTPMPEVRTLDRALIDRTTKLYDAKEAELQRLKAGAASVVDPSL